MRSLTLAQSLDVLPGLASALRLDRIFRTKVWPLTLSIPWGLTPGPLPFYIPYPTWKL